MASLDSHEPDWENLKPIKTYDQALAEAKKWQQENGADSVVEIIEFNGLTGTVKALVDKNGVDDKIVSFP